VLRTGRWWRRTSVVPYERIQSMRVRQGPLARRRGLAAIHLDMVDHAVSTTLSNLEATEAAEIQRVVSERALRRRRTERLDRWLARAVEGTDDGPGGPEGSDEGSQGGPEGSSDDRGGPAGSAGAA
jgi:membrane-flanked domain protein (fragment)